MNTLKTAAIIENSKILIVGARPKKGLQVQVCMEELSQPGYTSEMEVHIILTLSGVDPVTIFDWRTPWKNIRGNVTIPVTAILNQRSECLWSFAMAILLKQVRIELGINRNCILWFDNGITDKPHDRIPAHINLEPFFSPLK